MQQMKCYNPSGWMAEDIFVLLLKHFVEFAICTLINQYMDQCWMLINPVKAMTIYDIPEFWHFLFLVQQLQITLWQQDSKWLEYHLN